MKTVTVTEAKARIGALLKLVAKGETVSIVSRGRPVAELRPPGVEEHTSERVRKGVIRPAARKLDLERIARNRESLPKGLGVLQALLDEREEGW